MDGWLLVESCYFGWILLTLAVIDWRTYRLPYALVLALAAGGFVGCAVSDLCLLPDRIVGAAAGFLALTAVGWAYRRLRHRDGLGSGDAKLLAGIGAWVSWSGLPTVILLAAGVGLSAALARGLSGTRLRATDRLPFGPCLAIAAWIVWLYGPLRLGGAP